MKRVAVLKLGGELIETKDRLKALGKAVVSAAKKNRLIVVHGGGREIDAALAQVEDALKGAHGDAPFVRLTGADLPEIKHVAHTNFCDIGWKVDEARRRVVLVAVIDNLVKGAAGSAVQNLNVLLGLDERTGLL